MKKIEIITDEHRQYVEHQVILECNERFRNKGEEQNVLPGTPGTDPKSHEGVAKEKPGKIPGVSERVLE